MLMARQRFCTMIVPTGAMKKNHGHVVEQADQLRVTLRSKRSNPPAVVGEDERRESHPNAEDVGVGEDTARRGGPGYLYSGHREKRNQRARNEIAQYRDAEYAGDILGEERRDLLGVIVGDSGGENTGNRTVSKRTGPRPAASSIAGCAGRAYSSPASVRSRDVRLVAAAETSEVVTLLTSRRNHCRDPALNCV
jgi:hypothetical protein